ncbi:unnamed protein product [Schistosoma curassoni]|uniref:Uncharacterized protein n=1 Tax=Schistosoma curassoni TaxID=6186 RepID=A0A183JNB1_9TREM|nr:unnamed protein product [Schistosoma curassoni]
MSFIYYYISSALPKTPTHSIFFTIDFSIKEIVSCNFSLYKVPKFPKPPIIGPPYDLPESDQDSRQIQPPAQIPIESDVLENAKKLPTQTLPISKNLSPIAAFKYGTLISKEEIQGGVPANKTVASMRDKVREVSYGSTVLLFIHRYIN